MRVNYYQLTEEELSEKSFSEGTFYYCTDSKTFYFDPIGQTERVPIGGGTGTSGGISITVDSVLSNSSTNPVQNKVVTNALAGKASTNHNHDAEAINAGAFGGACQQMRGVGNTALLRNSSLSTTETTPSYNGEINWVYE